MFYIPSWVKQLDTEEKVIAFLQFFGRYDLVEKFNTKGYVYLSELLNAPSNWSSTDWSNDPSEVKYTEYIDFMK